MRGEAAKRHIFSILDLKSSIDPLGDAGEKPTAPVVGRIGAGALPAFCCAVSRALPLSSPPPFSEFRDVHFSYPTRPAEPVLRGLNLVINPGEVRAAEALA